MNKKIFTPVAIVILACALLVAGLALWQYFGIPKGEIPTEKAQSEDKTTDWETYRNEEYGFEMKYPSDFTEQKVEYGTDSMSTNLLSTTGTDNVCSYYFNINIRKNYKINNIFFSVKDAKEINIGSSLGYEYFFTEGVGYSGVALVQTGQDQLSIVLDCIGKNSTPSNQKKSDVQDFFNQILSTFRFLE